MERVTKMVSEKPVVIFSRSTCPVCYTIKTLFNDFGVNATICELDEVSGGNEIEQALTTLGCRSPIVPVVFIGGELIGGTNEVMSLHLRMSLIPKLKRAGALWL